MRQCIAREDLSRNIQNGVLLDPSQPSWGGSGGCMCGCGANGVSNQQWRLRTPHCYPAAVRWITHVLTQLLSTTPASDVWVLQTSQAPLPIQCHSDLDTSQLAVWCQLVFLVIAACISLRCQLVGLAALTCCEWPCPCPCMLPERKNRAYRKANTPVITGILNCLDHHNNNNNGKNNTNKEQYTGSQRC